MKNIIKKDSHKEVIQKFSSYLLKFDFFLVNAYFWTTAQGRKMFTFKFHYYDFDGGYRFKEFDYDEEGLPDIKENLKSYHDWLVHKKWIMD